ncbi:MAG: endonuclease/exonuclease/phosphatase family protein [Bacteroidota bacterium]
MTEAVGGRTTPRRRRGAVWGWTLFGLLDVPLVAAVGVGLAASVLPPGPYWWAQLVAIGLPYAAWAALLVALPLIAVKRWGLAALHLALVALVAVRALPAERFSAAPPEAGDLALTTFNVPTVGPSRETLGDSVVAFVREAAPDVLVMQDAWVFAPGVERSHLEAVQVLAVREALPYALALPARMAGHPGWRENGTGVPMLVRQGAGIEIVEQEALVLGTERDADVSLALRTHLRWNGREVVLYNLHLRSFGEAKPWADDAVRVLRPSTWVPYLRQYRRAYAQRGTEVEQIAARVEAETLPVVIAGDFNSTADNWSYRRLRRAGAIRHDAFRTRGGLAWGRTYPAARPLVRIDFVLADPALEVVAAETRDVTFSDHRPVSVHLRWREGPAAASPEAASSEAASPEAE